MRDKILNLKSKHWYHFIRKRDKIHCVFYKWNNNEYNICDQTYNLESLMKCMFNENDIVEIYRINYPITKEDLLMLKDGYYNIINDANEQYIMKKEGSLFDIYSTGYLGTDVDLLIKLEYRPVAIEFINSL